MKNTNLTIFANFFVDTEENFLRLQDSFFSFYKVNPKQWVIGVRGSQKIKVKNFLSSYLDKEILYIKILNDKSNWIKESRNLFNKVVQENIFLWVEDHICQITETKLSKIIREFEEFEIDQMVYSFWHDKLKQRIDFLKPKICNNFKYVEYPSDKNKFLISNGINFVNALPAIYSKKFMNKILFSNSPFLKRWPKYTPFDFEKKIGDIPHLHNYAVPILEIFAPIDDDHGLLDSEFYSLQQRGLYPLRITREQHLIKSKRKKKSIPIFSMIKKNKIISYIYFFYRRIILTFS